MNVLITRQETTPSSTTIISLWQHAIKEDLQIFQTQQMQSVKERWPCSFNEAYEKRTKGIVTEFANAHETVTNASLMTVPVDNILVHVMIQVVWREHCNYSHITFVFGFVGIIILPEKEKARKSS